MFLDQVNDAECVWLDWLRAERERKYQMGYSGDYPHTPEEDLRRCGVMVHAIRSEEKKKSGQRARSTAKPSHHVNHGAAVCQGQGCAKVGSLGTA